MKWWYCSYPQCDTYGILKELLSPDVRENHNVVITQCLDRIQVVIKGEQSLIPVTQKQSERGISEGWHITLLKINFLLYILCCDLNGTLFFSSPPTVFNLFGNPSCDYEGQSGVCYGEVECLALAGTFGAFCMPLHGLCCLCKYLLVKFTWLLFSRVHIVPIRGMWGHGCEALMRT